MLGVSRPRNFSHACRTQKNVRGRTPQTLYGEENIEDMGEKFFHVSLAEIDV